LNNRAASALSRSDIQPITPVILTAFHEGNSFFCKAVKLINQRVNLRVGGGDLAFQRELVSEQVIQP
jgi:hypothetical protein